MGDFDIASNIKTIERLKADILGNVSDLYTNMLMPAEFEEIEEERKDLLSNLVIMTYVLSNRLGISQQELETKIVNKLKIGILDEKNPVRQDLRLTLLHLDKKNDVKRK